MRPPLLQETDETLRRHAERTGDELRDAVEALLADLAGRGLRDQRALREALGLSQPVVSRLLTAVRRGDSLGTLGALPGPEALRQMVRGAARSGVEAGCVARVDRAVSGFEGFLSGAVGSRSTLDAMLSDWSHESRGAFELRHKSAAFKAMSALRGVRADLILNAAIVHPSTTGPAVYDSIGLDALLGCRRLRPRAELRLVGWQMPPADSGFAIGNLDGGAITATADMLLPDFSSVPGERLATRLHRGSFETIVSGLPLGEVGVQGEDLVCAQLYRGLQRARRGDGPPSSGVAGQAEPPCETFVVDALLHPDAWPGIAPEVRIFDTVVRGIAHPDDASRQGDRLELQETAHFLGIGPDAFRLNEFPRYPELVRHACERAGWDAEQLRGWRCRVRHPIHGSQIGLAFGLT